MDISKIDTKPEDEGTIVQINDVNGEPEEGTTITVVGSYSKHFQNAMNAKRHRLSRRRNMTTMELRVEAAAAGIVTWEGFTDSGQPYPPTQENAIALLVRAPWIMEQVEEVMNDHASFFSKSALTS